MEPQARMVGKFRIVRALCRVGVALENLIEEMRVAGEETAALDRRTRASVSAVGTPSAASASSTVASFATG